MREVEPWEPLAHDVDFSFAELTAVVEMLAIAHITVASGRDVEVTLHLIQIQASVDAAAVGRTLESGGPRPLRPLLSKRNNIVNVFLAETLILVLWLVVSLPGADSTLAIPSKSVNALVVGPLPPESPVSAKTLSRHDAIARSILDVNMNIIALHLDYNVQVDLQFSRNTSLNLEVVRLSSTPPATKLTPDENK